MVLFFSVCLEGHANTISRDGDNDQREVNQGDYFQVNVFKSRVRELRLLLFLQPENEVIHFVLPQHRLSDQTKTHHSILLTGTQASICMISMFFAFKID